MTRAPMRPDDPADALESGGEPTFALVGGGPDPEPSPDRDCLRADVLTAVAVHHPQAVVTRGRAELGGRMVGFSSVGRGEPVVLLPDRDDAARAWQPVIGALSATCLLVSVALPGYGEGDPATDRESAGGHAALLRGLLRTLGRPSASVIGHGLGAVVALRFAEYYPGLTRRLVLIGGTAADDGTATGVDFGSPSGPGDAAERVGRHRPSGARVLHLAPGGVPGRPVDGELLSSSALASMGRFLEVPPASR